MRIDTARRTGSDRRSRHRIDARPSVSLAVTLIAVLTLAQPPRAQAPGDEAIAPGCPSVEANGQEDWQGQRQWQRLERAGYRLGELRIAVDDVYRGDALPWYQQLANTLHIDTRTSVIRSLLTIERGQAVEAKRIFGAERTLRERRFLTRAKITPLRCHDQEVDAVVQVRDAWTLQAGASVGTSGGQTTTSAGFEDENFLGTGTTVSLDWTRTPARTTKEVGFFDPALLGSQWTLGLSHSELSDGQDTSATIAYPYRSFDQRWRFEARGANTTKTLDFDQAGATAYTARLRRKERSVEVRRLIASDGETGWRGGIGWRRDRYRYDRFDKERSALRPAPELTDRDFAGPYIVVERFRDRYRSFRNLRSIGRTRDYNLGIGAEWELGRYRDRTGNDKPLFTELSLDYGAQLGPRHLVLSRFELSGRYSEKRGRQAYYRSAAIDYYLPTSRRNTIVAHAEADWRSQPDPEGELYLGGFYGLQAYPNRFRVGDRRWLTHLEDRYVTDTVLFDTVQLGYTAYLEAARIRGLDGHWSRTLADVGVGLRIGSLRSSFSSVAYVTVATPLVNAGQKRDYEWVVGSTFDF